jgi:hypothetical protein
MQLRTARLCLDCDEVHDEYRCPVCASDEFTYISRWIPVPDSRRPRPRQARTAPPEYDAYREIVKGPGTAPQTGRRWTKALVGLGAASVAGLFFGARQARGRAEPDDRG